MFWDQILTIAANNLQHF